MMEDDSLVVVQKVPFKYWGLVSSGETGEEAVARIMGDVQRHIKDCERGAQYMALHGQKKQEQQYLSRIEEYRAVSLDVVTLADMFEMQRRNALDRPMQEITAEEYSYALNVLPPEFFGECGSVTVFNMSEHDSGLYTGQYARDNSTGKYWYKTVDSTDCSTWIPALLYPKKEVSV